MLTEHICVIGPGRMSDSHKLSSKKRWQKVNRRNVLKAIAIGSTLGISGCLNGRNVSKGGQGTPTPTETATATPEPTEEPLDYGGELSGEFPDPIHSYSATIGGVAVTVDTMAKNLEIPWAVDFSPDGRIFVTERVGRVRVIGPRGLVDQSYAEPPSIDAESTTYGEKAIWWVKGGEGGLLGLALHPQFPDVPYIYLYYSHRKDGQTFNRVARVRESDLRGGQEEVLLDGIPGGQFHDGGRIKFGPDGMLYVATGEGGQKELAQETDSFGGKILRMTPDGEPAPGNPFTGEKGRYVYSYGHRNPQGLAWDDDDQLYATEHGEVAHDEVNRIERGANYGWPEYRGDDEAEGITPPIFESGAETWAPSGATFYYGDIEEWKESLFFAGLKGEALHRVELDGEEVETHDILLKNWYGRMRTVVQGPEGNLWFTTSNRDGRGRVRKDDDQLIRIRPAEQTLEE